MNRDAILAASCALVSLGGIAIARANPPIANPALANPLNGNHSPQLQAQSSPSIPEATDSNGQPSGIETVYEFGPETPPGNIAIGPDGRIFMSLHVFYGQPVKVVEVAADGSVSRQQFYCLYLVRHEHVP